MRILIPVKLVDVKLELHRLKIILYFRKHILFYGKWLFTKDGTAWE